MPEPTPGPDWSTFKPPASRDLHIPGGSRLEAMPSPYPPRCRCGAYPPDAAHMCESDGPEFESVRIMRLQPDDVIVVEVDYPVSAHDIDQFKARLEHTFPGHKAIVLDNGARLSVARPDEVKHDPDGPVGGIGCWKPVE
jgi:hypothetical protein